MDDGDLEFIGIRSHSHRAFILHQRDVYRKNSVDLDRKNDSITKVHDWLRENKEYLF